MRDYLTPGVLVVAGLWAAVSLIGTPPPAGGLAFVASVTGRVFGALITVLILSIGITKIRSALAARRSEG